LLFCLFHNFSPRLAPQGQAHSAFNVLQQLEQESARFDSLVQLAEAVRERLETASKTTSNGTNESTRNPKQATEAHSNSYSPQKSNNKTAPIVGSLPQTTSLQPFKELPQKKSTHPKPVQKSASKAHINFLAEKDAENKRLLDRIQMLETQNSILGSFGGRHSGKNVNSSKQDLNSIVNKHEASQLPRANKGSSDNPHNPWVYKGSGQISKAEDAPQKRVEPVFDELAPSNIGSSDNPHNPWVYKGSGQISKAQDVLRKGFSSPPKPKTNTDAVASSKVFLSPKSQKYHQKPVPKGFVAPANRDRTAENPEEKELRRIMRGSRRFLFN